MIGEVTSGQDVVARIGELGDARELPTVDVVVDSIKISRSG